MTEERPASLRRRPRPAADERVDPIDPRPTVTEPTPQTSAVPDQKAPASVYAPAPDVPPARALAATPSVRAATVQLSVRVAPDVVQLLDGAVAAARARGERLTQRAAIEQAIRQTWA